MPTTAIDELRAALPPGRLMTDAADVEGYRRDAARLIDAGQPMAVVRARDTTDVQATLRWASRHQVPIVPRGAGTGLAGGAVATDGCVVLSLRDMTSIIEINVDDQLAVVQPGVLNSDLQIAAARDGLMFAPDPASFDISTLGGNIATNAGGLRCVKYGVTRESVLGLQVVLADGRLLNTGHRTVKGVAGYDLTALFVGSEGTLGVITQATVKLQAKPVGDPVTVVGVFATLPAAGAAVNAVMRAGVVPSLLELLDNATIRAVDDYAGSGELEAGPADRHGIAVLDRSAAAMLIAQLDGVHGHEPAELVATIFAEAGATSTTVSSDAAQAAALLNIRRSSHWAIEQLGPVLTEDVGVPRSRLAEMLARIEEIARTHEVVIATVGHAGDGNLHPSIVVDSPRARLAAEAVYRAALELGGTITGEHGIGLLKQPWLREEIGDVSHQIHHTIKASFDPLGILNPGKAI